MTSPAPEKPGPADASASYPVSERRQRFAGAVVSVRTDQVQLPAGEEVTRDVVEHPGAVGVIELDWDERVLLVRQYRHCVGRMLWEPPAGLLDVDGEPPLATAQRELDEEAGYRAEQWAVLVDAFTSPGMTDEAMRVYLARALTAVPEPRRHVGEHEEADMPMCWLDLDDAVGLVLVGQLHNPTAVMGLLAARRARERGWSELRPADAPWPERPVAGTKG
jgi:ADP-ribose pyrophosphatase